MTAIGYNRTTNKTIDLSTDDRRRHVYCIGQTGVGKSTLLESMALEDISSGRGLVFIDPHGQSAENIASNIPVWRTQDAVYLEYDPEHPFGLNVLETANPRKKPLTIEHVVSTFRSIWRDSWGPNLEDVLRNSLYLLLDTPHTSLMDVLTLISDATYRKQLMHRCNNVIVRQFWEDEFEAKADKQKAEETRSTTNKVRAFLSNPYLADIIAGPSTLNISHLMDRGKVLILNLAKGSWGETPSKLLGCLFVIAITQAAEGRLSVPEPDRKDFCLFVDELQNFQNESFATILSESRKSRLSLMLANQYYTALPETLQAAISGNVGTWIAFRIGSKDARLIADELDHHNPRALSSTANYEAWVRTISSGVPTEPLPLRTFPPNTLAGNRLTAIRARTRACHTRPKTRARTH